MSLPNASIANLLVTCKSLVTRNLQCPFPVPFPDADDRLAATRTQIKSRRWMGAGSGRRIFLAAIGAEKIV
jgi:hypothetical protein